MGRPKGSRNKENVLGVTPRKHLVENMDDQKVSTISEESNNVPMRKSIPQIRAARVSNVSQQEYEGMEKNASINATRQAENELSSIHQGVRETGKDQETSMRNMRGYVQSSAPSRLYETPGNQMAVQEMPYEDAPKIKIRQYSTNKDHKGEGEPLCFGCGHRSDMHYVEHRWTEQRVGKNLQGDFLTVEERKMRKMYDGARPCQHACLCKSFE
jgi:hypothetical protein